MCCVALAVVFVSVADCAIAVCIVVIVADRFILDVLFLLLLVLALGAIAMMAAMKPRELKSETPPTLTLLFLAAMNVLASERQPATPAKRSDCSKRITPSLRYYRAANPLTRGGNTRSDCLPVETQRVMRSLFRQYKESSVIFVVLIGYQRDPLAFQNIR